MEQFEKGLRCEISSNYVFEIPLLCSCGQADLRRMTVTTAATTFVFSTDQAQYQ